MSVSIPDPVDAAATEAATEVLDDAPTRGDVLALSSFGHDSLTAAHLARQSRLGLNGVVHVNTGIGIPETRQFGKRRVAELGLDYYEVGAPDPAAGYVSEYRQLYREYESLVLEHGFPGPAIHGIMYINLKHEPLKAWLDAHYPDREVTLVSGVRRHESDRRMENVDETGRQDYLGAPTISPLVEFTGLDVTRYRSALGLPRNPVVDLLHMSGECLCGAYAARGERRTIRRYFPRVHRYLTCLETKVLAAAYTDDGPDRRFARWGHGRLHEREQKAMDDDAQALLCESCEQRSDCTDEEQECGG